MPSYTREFGWLLPSLGLTGLLAVGALLLMPNMSGVLPALGLLPLWLWVSAMLAAVAGYVQLAVRKVPNPTGYMIAMARTRWPELLVMAVGITLAGFNMCAFMWTKPLLNYYVPFWADPMLARIDQVIFFGRDPWTLLDWLNGFGPALFYHRGWFAMMIVTLLIVLSRPPSAQKSAIMLTYFLLWSVAGPLIHVMAPAAGPIFYEKLGYGPQFAALQVPPIMTEMSDYLWRVYNGERFGPGSGISAMPSLHIATTVWMIIAVHSQARRWTWPTAALGFLIFLLSISLGWHYAVDGIVGGLAALGCYWLALRWYDDRPMSLAKPLMA